jgi:serine/threonine protein kinase
LQENNDKMKTLTGSPYYCSPEVITRDSYDNKVDLWSLGIVAVEMAETKVPYSNMDPLQVIFRIPKEEPPKLKEANKWSPEFKEFLSKCLQKNPVIRSSAKNLLFVIFIENSEIIFVSILLCCKDRHRKCWDL